MAGLHFIFEEEASSKTKRREMKQAGKLGKCGLAAIILGVFFVSLTSPASADPALAVKLSDVSSFRWDGAANNVRLGNQNIANIGDVNGDGRDDVAATTGTAIYVLFSPPNGGGSRLLNPSLGPDRGYRINWLGSGNAVLAGLGDQNGDDVPDMLAASFGSAKVIYGVSDPSALPQCSGPDPARCLDGEALTAAQGYTLIDPDPPTGFGSSAANAGDVDGDGVDDFLVGAPGAATQAGSAYLIYGDRAAPGDGSPTDITTLPAAEVIRFDGAGSGDVLGAAVNGVGDLIGDGKSDFALAAGGAGLTPAEIYVIDGGLLSGTSPVSISTFGPGQGFSIAPPIFTAGPTINAGDVNGDGRSDLAVGGMSFISQAGYGAVIYGPASNPAEPVSAVDPTDDQGYSIAPVETNGQLGSPYPNNAIANIGDLNGDGVPDQLFAAGGTASNGNNAAGAAYAILGQRPTPAEPLGLGPDLTADHGIALVGSTANALAGQSLAPAGDIDDDGLPDMFVDAPQARESGFTNSGSIYLVLGRALIGKPTTGPDPEVTETTATLEGGGLANGRESTLYFEWGATDEYGSTTPVVPFGKSNGNQWEEAEITGLTKDTEYHYRAVLTNDLGLKSYGQDQTFRTAETPPGPCVLDPTAPGCNVIPPEPKNPKLSSLIVGQSRMAVKRGKKAVISVSVVNAGNADAKNVKFCIKAPKKLVKARGCKTRSVLVPGATSTQKFRVSIPRKAKKGKKANVTLTAQADGLGKKTAKVKIRIR